MHDYLVSHGVVCLLLAATFSMTGLLGLWAAVSDWRWFNRTAMIVVLLSPLLLRPTFEVLLTLLAQVLVTAGGVAAYQNRGAIWDTLRRRRPLPRPQFDMSSLLAAMGLAGVVAAVSAAMRAPRHALHFQPTFTRCRCGIHDSLRSMVDSAGPIVETPTCSINLLNSARLCLPANRLFGESRGRHEFLAER